MEDFVGVVGVSKTRESPCLRSHILGGAAGAMDRVSEGFGLADKDYGRFNRITMVTTKDGINVAQRSSSVEGPNVGPESVRVENGSPLMLGGSVFDPFAASKCDALRARSWKKLLDELSDCLACRQDVGSDININYSDDGTQAMDEEIIDYVYRHLLEVIVMEQADEILGCISVSGMDLGICQTPTLSPLLNGIADSCPGAPIKSPPKSRVIDWGLRRKLDF